MTGKPSFQVAEEPDRETLIEFMRRYYAFDGHGFDDEKARMALTKLLRDPNLGRVWLIFDGAEPVGYVVIRFGYSLEWLVRDAFVDEFFLLPDYRGRGWGRATMAFVEDAARALNVRALHLEVVRQNAAALQIYGKLGFKERQSTLMSKWIARDSSTPALTLLKRGHYTLTSPLALEMECPYPR